MSEPEKYTLTQVLKIVRTHAQALGNAAAALEATDGNDLEVLALVGERALKASKELWDLEGGSPVGLDEDARAPWSLLTDDNGALWALPVLVLAVEAATTNPQGGLPPEPDGALPRSLPNSPITGEYVAVTQPVPPLPYFAGILEVGAKA